MARACSRVTAKQLDDGIFPAQRETRKEVPVGSMQSSMTRYGVLSLAVLLAGSLSPPAQGGDEDLLFAEIPTVYAASRREQPVRQAPAAVTIIRREDIRKYGYRTLGQALASVPGFFLTDDRGYQYIGVRGLSIPTDYNIRVLFLLNGLPLNDKYYGTFLPELTPDMLDAIERIEVVKGPSSSLYGSNALFAIINIVTRKGADVGGAVVSGEVGSDPSGRGVFSYGKLFDNGLDLFLSGHYEASEGEHSISLGSFGRAEDADAHHLANAYLSARYQDFFLQLWYADRKKEIPTGQYGTILGDDRTTTEDTWYLAELRWQRAFDGDKTLMLRGYYQHYPYRGTYAYDDPDFALNVEDTLDRWIGYEAQFNWRPLEQHQLTLGALYEYHWTRLSGDYRDASGAISFVYPGTRDDFSYWALYAQEEFRILSNLTLTAGVRYDDYPDFGEARFSPRAALVWAATKQTTVKLLYGQAFRAPSQYERTYPVGSDMGPPNPNIDPEVITTYELVLEQDFRHGLFGRLSVFHNDVQKLIAAVSDAPDPVIFDNLFDVRTTGVEAELTKKFANGVRGFVNGTWQHSETAGGTLINSPEWIANLGVVVPIVGDKLSVAVRENFVSSRATRVPGRRTEDAFVSDLTISSENALPGWSFHFSVLNLLDERFGVPSGEDGTLDIIPQRGRMVFFRASYRF